MKRIANLFMISAACLLAFSCTKEGGEDTAATKAVLGVSITDLPAIVEVPESQSQSFEVLVVANPGPSDAIYVTLGTDASLVEKYNATNGTAYELLPEAAYELPASALMVMKYNKTSAPGTIRFKGAGCVQDKEYLLPVVVASVKGTAAYEAPEERIAYVIFKMLEAQMAGSGVESDPYLVTTTDEFKKIGNILKTGETVYVKLGGDIDFNGAAWSQADATGSPIAFDGDNHVVKNVVAEHSMFYNLEGTVKNVVFDNIVLETAVEQGGLLSGTAGTEDGTKTTIKNVTVTNSKVNSVGHVGGLIGRITNCIVDNVNVACDVKGIDRIGGMFGHTIGSTITNSSASGNVTAESYYSGGLIGMMHSTTLTGCSATGNVTHTTNTYSRIGGLVGQMICNCSVEKCFATGAVYGGGYFGGGLIGVIETVETVDGKETVHTATIKQSYSTGSITLIRDAKDAGAGGLVGRFETGKLEIYDCYTTCAVEADRYSGAFVGDVNKGDLKIVNGFCNSDLSKLGPDANGNHSDGVAIGCIRTPDATTVKCNGFVAWNTLDVKKFSYQDLVPSAGNYFGAEETISAQAQKFGWDAAIWDLSGDTPKLK